MRSTGSVAEPAGTRNVIAADCIARHVLGQQGQPVGKRVLEIAFGQCVSRSNPMPAGR